eukprot:6520500-Pyramimonas_sp.AAC.1
MMYLCDAFYARGSSGFRRMRWTTRGSLAVQVCILLLSCSLCVEAKKNTQLVADDGATLAGEDFPTTSNADSAGLPTQCAKPGSQCKDGVCFCITTGIKVGLYNDVITEKVTREQLWQPEGIYETLRKTQAPHIRELLVVYQTGMQ